MLASLQTSGVPLIERRYSRGEHAYMRGDPDEGLWFLLEGTMEVYKLYGAFSKATVRLLDGSGLFGEPSLRPAGRHRDSAEALSACRVAKVLKSPLLRHLSEDSSCAPALLQAFAECAEEREAAVQRLLERKVDSRLASLLLELAERFGEEGGRGEGIEDAPEPPRPLLHGGVHARVRLRGHGRAQGGRSHRDAEAMPRRRAGRAAPEQGGDGTADNGTGRVHGGYLGVLGDARASS